MVVGRPPGYRVQWGAVLAAAPAHQLPAACRLGVAVESLCLLGCIGGVGLLGSDAFCRTASEAAKRHLFEGGLAGHFCALCFFLLGSFRPCRCNSYDLSGAKTRLGALYLSLSPGRRRRRASVWCRLREADGRTGRREEGRGGAPELRIGDAVSTYLSKLIIKSYYYGGSNCRVLKNCMVDFLCTCSPCAGRVGYQVHACVCMLYMGLLLCFFRFSVFVCRDVEALSRDRARKDCGNISSLFLRCR